jgi:hypothetical protein
MFFRRLCRGVSDDVRRRKGAVEHADLEQAVNESRGQVLCHTVSVRVGLLAKTRSKDG